VFPASILGMAFKESLTIMKSYLIN